MSEVKKILGIDGLYFHLPDDYEGTLPEAFRLLADYLEKPTPNLHNKSNPKLCEHNIWNQFLDDVKKGGKVCGSIRLSEYDEEKKKWEKINGKTLPGVNFEPSARTGLNPPTTEATQSDS